MSLFIYSLVHSFICTNTSVSSLAGKSETLSNASWPKVDKVSSARPRQSPDSFRIFPRTEKRACFQFFTLVFIYARIYLFFSSFICCLNLTSFVIFFLSSLLITSLGHIKLTDFGLSKIGLMNSKYSFSICFHSTVSCFQGFIWNPFDPESFVPHISFHILHTVLYTSLKVLIKRICVTIKSLLNSRSFPLFS